MASFTRSYSETIKVYQMAFFSYNLVKAACKNVLLLADIVIFIANKKIEFELRR